MAERQGLKGSWKNSPLVSKLDQFLHSVFTEGQYQDSGAFTVDQRKARRNLSKFQLSGPEWIPLKLIQAAVACKSLCVVVQTGRKELKVTFPVPANSPMSRYPNSGEMCDGFLDMSFLAASEAGDWTFQYQDYDGGFRIDLKNSEETVQKLGPRYSQADFSEYLKLMGDRYEYSELSSLAVRYPGVAAFQRKWKSRWWNFTPRLSIDGTSHQHSALLKRCQYCPIPIFIDGFLANHPEAQYFSGPRILSLVGEGEPALLGPTSVIKDSFVELPWGLVTSEKSAVDYDIRDYVRLTGVDPYRPDGPVEDLIWLDDKPVAIAPKGSQFVLARPLESGSAYDRLCRWCLVDRQNSKPGALVPVYCGVTLDDFESPHLPEGSRVLLAADGMQTDLAGQRLVETPEVEEFLQECVELLGPLRQASLLARERAEG